MSGEDDHMDLSGVGVWSSHLRYGNPDVAGELRITVSDRIAASSIMAT